MGDWIAFWDSKHSIYVNARHRDVHYRTIAQDIRRASAVPARAVLDYGCGEALSAEIVAAGMRRLILCEAAPKVRAALAARFAGDATIEVRSPDEVAALPAGSLDVVVLHSVAQYLAPDELDRSAGALSRGCCVPAGCSSWAISFRPTSRRRPTRWRCCVSRGANGFFIAALLGLARTVALTDYWRLRSNLGLTRYGEADMIAKLAAAGFAAKRAAEEYRPQPGAHDVPGAAEELTPVPSRCDQFG